ncbi:MAG: sulfurtransferase complex subunit TusB [Motiliproteus sp.]
MVLHTVNSSPKNSHCLADCLRVITPPALLLLIEDGVYGATDANKALWQSLPKEVECYVLQADIDARGLAQLITPHFSPVDDSGFVELTIRATKVQSWY